MKTKDIFVCSGCGAQAIKWQGQCPRCGEWNTLQQKVVVRKKGAVSHTYAGVRTTALADIPTEHTEARSTGFAPLDTVLGKGFVPGGAVLVGGEPGIGKSTLLLQLACAQAQMGNRAVYFSGEESLAQIRGRAERLGLLNSGMLAIASTNSEEALAILEAPEKPDLLIIDSVQTLNSSRAEGIPGCVSQVRAVSSELVEAAKKTTATLVLVGHVTKDGQIAGPKLLEHMVDTVLYLEGDRKHMMRIMRVLKNRFGPSDELVVFSMRESGMEIVEDPSTLFLGDRDDSFSGAAVVMAMDGHKPFAVEVQALASRSVLSIPRRTALGFDTNRLNLILAVLEKRLNLNLGQLDIYAKIGGGLAMRDPGLDLGVAAAVLSSFYDRPLPAGSVFWGEVDLNGRIRPASGGETRLKQADRLGYGPIFQSESCRTLDELQNKLFGPNG
ncbi:DNA repair protein RadA [Maridesulfovibrio ferrireducens]|uniref:DNA repair protein RadA n=1 Tax=Maridesulfovibrio ferrireducens TaxID=246191 RepID=UPI001A333305|nr:DNA repair protein RadA [Maridesulfovibrio ferrireducens]MBI9112722.1 DNA repair protein RadA [Maridesulfovibrio ferrireducens]